MKTCKTCGYYRQSDRECGNYFGPKAQANVNPEDSCKEYATQIEVDVKSVCCTSVDCAKDRICKIGPESIRACLKKETRSTVRKMLESRLRKLARKDRRREDAIMDEIKRERKMRTKTMREQAASAPCFMCPKEKKGKTDE
jgi:hypothetical protein